ncbi:unnamed protein product [Anisakis simplex]|uniref:Uncharacterized protein n=1 Tax=Anisakis simplex TaxID=6269 RepID=A0A0M3J8C4_ANISI|nr:unnamed protein product [Anisakis simplex]
MSNEDVQASTSRITSSAPSVTLPRARSSSTTALHRSEVFDQKCKDDETRSQQVNMLVSPARIPLLKRALSFQVSSAHSAVCFI